MKKSTKIVMSTASVAAAIQGLSNIHAENRKVSIGSTDSFQEQAAAAVTSSQAQAMIRASIVPIAATVRLDDRLMSERYAAMYPGADEEVIKALEDLEAGSFLVAQVYLQDSTAGTTTLSCYSNCHSACHGSRSWR